MVNWRGVANSYTRAINPNIVGQIRRSNGYTTAASGKRTPTYEDLAPITVQAQALSFKDLTQLDGLNIQGTRRALYFDGVVLGIVRVKQVGGDVLVFPDGTFPEGNEWLCVHVLEQWPQWGKVAITLQNPGT